MIDGDLATIRYENEKLRAALDKARDDGHVQGLRLGYAEFQVSRLKADIANLTEALNEWRSRAKIAERNWRGLDPSA